ncbi:GerAB/ArcD/ProY family transporter [Paenibacillus sp. NEAU-GSW1]|nr:GerAB/ArcD/ProY family transporter [Paenibacillus sp. NEAU-GSW1]
MILFLIGSSSLFLLAGDAERDAWIAVLVGAAAGFALFSLVTLSLHKSFPQFNLVQLLTGQFGRPIGIALSYAYILYFCYKSIRNVREFADLTVMYLLPRTPLVIIVLIICLLAAYVVHKGIFVYFSMAEAILPFVIAMYGLLFFLIAVSGLLRYENVFPILENGIKPVLKAALPELISFPFGELVLFLMFFNFSEQKGKAAAGLSMQVYLFCGLFIAFANLLLVAGMGKLGSATTMPFMQMATLIEIAGLQRIDPFVAILLFTGVFFKLTAYYLGAVLALSYLFGVKHTAAIWPVGTVLFTGSMLFASYMEQVWFGFKLNLNYHFPVFQIVLPVLLLLVLRLRQGWSKKVKQNDG